MPKSLIKLPFTRLEAIAFATGMAVLTFELVAARVTAPYLGDTIYTWTAIIGVILAALAYGVYKGGAWADNRKRPADIILCLLGAATLIVVLNFTKDSFLGWITGWDTSLQMQAFIASIVLFAPATFILGVISPYLARLSIRDVATSGRHLSRIDAATTFGSLVGTFLTGFVLFGIFGSRHLLAFIAIGLVATSFLVPSKDYRWWQFGVLIVTLLASFGSPAPALKGFVAEVDTAYSRIIIRDIDYEGRKLRVYQTDRDGLQSGVYVGGRQEQPFSYVRGFSYLSDMRPAGERYLVIGGGAFTFPSYLANKEPRARVDTVEIDNRLPGISRQYFNFKQPSNLHIISADGRTFLNQNQQQYDMVFQDAFTASVPPFQLLTRESASRLRDALKDDGIMVANIISATDGFQSLMLRYIYNTYRAEFPHLMAFSVDPENAKNDPWMKQNVLLVGSKQPLDPTRLTALTDKNPEFAEMLAAKVDPSSDNKRLVMTDDYAPVEQLAL